MKGNRIIRIAVIYFEVFLITRYSAYLYQRAAADGLEQILIEDASFGRMRFSQNQLSQLWKARQETKLTAGEILTVYTVLNGAGGGGKAMDAHRLQRWSDCLLRRNHSGMERISRAYNAVWEDLRSAPVDPAAVWLENSWEHTDGSVSTPFGISDARKGIDVMMPEGIPGVCEAASMTDGRIRCTGRNPDGSGFIEIQAPSGGRFLYSGLELPEEAAGEGAAITAGEGLGRIGYRNADPEDEIGALDVYLHIEIRVPDGSGGWQCVNPYPAIRWLLRMKNGREQSG